MGCFTALSLLHELYPEVAEGGPVEGNCCASAIFMTKLLMGSLLTNFYKPKAFQDPGYFLGFSDRLSPG
jgi:hypothetical protein